MHREIDRHDDRPSKYCRTCGTHFKATPEQHEETYHPDGEWVWFEGSWMEMQREVELDPRNWGFT